MAIRRRSWFPLVVGATALLAASSSVVGPLRRLIAEPAGPVIKPIALVHAENLYFERGAKYIWGDNDCSRFVVDYLKAVPVRVTERWTTAELDRPTFMADHGLRQVAGPAAPGDIVVFRYRHGDSWVGHCGVLVFRGKEPCVRHNSIAGGMCTDRLADFYALARRVGAYPGSLRAFRPPARPGMRLIAVKPQTTKLTHIPG